MYNLTNDSNSKPKTADLDRLAALFDLDDEQVPEADYGVATDAERHVEHQQLLTAVEDVMAGLNAQARSVITLTFGLLDCPSLDDDAIAALVAAEDAAHVAEIRERALQAFRFNSVIYERISTNLPLFA